MLQGRRSFREKASVRAGKHSGTFHRGTCRWIFQNLHSPSSERRRGLITMQALQPIPSEGGIETVPILSEYLHSARSIIRADPAYGWRRASRVMGYALGRNTRGYTLTAPLTASTEKSAAGSRAPCTGQLHCYRVHFSRLTLTPRGR